MWILITGFSTVFYNVLEGILLKILKNLQFLTAVDLEKNFWCGQHLRYNIYVAVLVKLSETRKRLGLQSNPRSMLNDSRK